MKPGMSIDGRALACAALVVVGFARPLSAQVRAQPPLEIYHGFTLIDGRGGPPIPDAAISVRGNEIITVGSRRELLSGPSAPRDAIVVNLGGGYVIPGLIDAHVHLATSPDRRHAEAELYRLLFGGVTAVRDMAGDARMLASLARDSRLGEIDAPDVYFSALMAGPSFMTDSRAIAATAGETPGEVPWMQAITPETDLVTAVARAKGTYATGIKIYANLERRRGPRDHGGGTPSGHARMGARDGLPGEAPRGDPGRRRRRLARVLPGVGGDGRGPRRSTATTRSRSTTGSPSAPPCSRRCSTR